MRDHTDDELLLMLAAYAYEKYAHSLITDAEFDQRCLALADIGTTIPDFQPDTGMWVHHHQVADRALMYVTDRIVEILGRAPDWEWRASAIAELRHLQRLLDNQN